MSLLANLTLVFVAGFITALATGLGSFEPGIGNVLEQGPIYLFPVFVVVAGAITYGEELGWRGYLLPELAERVGPVTATALVGVVWALYHAPALYFGAQATGLGDPVGSSNSMIPTVTTTAPSSSCVDTRFNNIIPAGVQRTDIKCVHSWIPRTSISSDSKFAPRL